MELNTAFRADTRVLACLLMLCAGLVPVGLAQDDSLAGARELYAGADYQDALAMLERVADTPGLAGRDLAAIDHYRALCLLALNRPAEATTAIEAMVTHDPLYAPTDEDLSPRTRLLFREVRLRRLPSVARERYTRAKADYEGGRMADAIAGFDQVVGVLDVLESSGNPPPLAADLRLLAMGFRQLAQAAARPVPAPDVPPAAPAKPPAATAKEPPRPVDVVPPTTVRQNVPPWPTELPFPEPAVTAVEVTIGPDGRVQEARLRQPLHPRYDQLLLAAARDWAYRPALRDGQPTPYVQTVRVEVARPR